jgi:hypothetical protein
MPTNKFRKSTNPLQCNMISPIVGEDQSEHNAFQREQHKKVRHSGHIAN